MYDFRREKTLLGFPSLFEAPLQAVYSRVLGDEVVKWNRHTLRGLAFEEVYDIIFDSKADPQVELVVQRPVGPRVLSGGSRCLPNVDGERPTTPTLLSKSEKSPYSRDDLVKISRDSRDDLVEIVGRT